MYRYTRITEYKMPQDVQSFVNFFCVTDFANTFLLRVMYKVRCRYIYKTPIEN